MIREILGILFPCIAILYFIDSIQYIGKAKLLFVNYFGKKYHLKKSGIHISKLSPVGATLISQNIPVYLTAKGLYAIKDEKLFEDVICDSGNFHFISYQDIKSIEADDREVKINGEKYLKAPSSISANIIKNQITEIKETTPDNRFKKIKKTFEKTFDISSIAKVSDDWSGYLLNLKIICTFLFINTFIVLPPILYSNLYAWVNIYLVSIYIVATYFIILLTTYFIHRKIYRAEKRNRMSVVLSMIFSPVSAMHATNYITTNLYARFDYLAIAGRFLSPDIFIHLAGKELLLIDHRRGLFDNSDWREYWNLKEKFIRRLITKAGYAADKVLKAPDKLDENAVSYCPFCRIEYLNDCGKCSDCGMGLKKF